MNGPEPLWCAPLRRRWVPAGLLVVAAPLALTACGGGALDSRGTGAAEVAGVWWLMFWLGAVIYAGFLAALFVALRRGRQAERGEQDGAPPRLAGLPLVMIGGVVVPAAVLILLTVVTAVVRPLEAGEDTIRIEVEGRQYWWHITYPDEGVVTANEVVIPVGEPVELALTSDDVIHSFWVPQVAGKVDMIPGQTNELVVEATEAGEYVGYCAEFCGLAHAQMRFLLIAEEPDDYAAWVRRQAEPAPEPETDLELRGREMFLGASCSDCHRIEGTDADSDDGPDLTHFASRRTLGAGMFPNTPGHLAGWIVDPQQMKPGNAMPGTRLDAEDLDALLAYMETLE